MRLPQKSASVSLRLSYGRYVARRLRRAKLSPEETEVRTLSDQLSAAEQAESALEEEFSSLLADRDAADDDLDDITKRHRQAIEGRSTNANKERPYTDIYPDGVAWYTASPLAEQASRYELLARRYGEFLPDGDPVRAEAGIITQGLAAWKDAAAAIDKAELDIAMARAKTRKAIDAWEEGLTRLYFRLGERFGKAQAERYFPKAARGRRAGEVDAPEPGEPVS